jgi:autotransporter-associated beta strand protein
MNKRPLAIKPVVKEGSPLTSNRSGQKASACALVLLMLVANFAFLAVAAVPAEVEKSSSRSSSRAPEACPSSAVGWTMSGTHVYTGACTISGGTVQVSASADITFEKVTMSISGTYYFFNYASLKILNSTITGSSNWYGIYGNTGNTLLKIENSTITGYYLYGARGYTGARMEIGNSTIVGQAGTAQYGIYAYNVNGGFITHNRIYNATSYGMYIYLSSSLWVNNNTVNCTSVSYGTYLNSFSGKFDNNTIVANTASNVIRLQASAPSSFWNNRVKGGTVRYFQYGSIMNVFRCNFSGATGTDVSIDNSGKLKAYDTYINTATTAAGAAVEVYWRANITVKWLSNAQVVPGARVDLTDARSVNLASGLTTDA